MKRHILVLLLLAACKRSETKPPPVTVASGTAVAVVVDAAVAVDAAIDAPVEVFAITTTGVGKLKQLAWGKQTEEETAALIQAALSPDLPGIKTSFDMMDVPGEVEREEGYWSVKRGETELVQVLRNSDPEKELAAAIIVWTAEIPTADGTKVGDKLGVALAKHADLVCTNTPGDLIVETVAADVQCHSPSERAIVYVLDPNKKKLKAGKPAASALAEIKVVAIAVVP